MAEFSTIARPYAKAVFEIAKDRGALAAWSQALHGAAVVVGDETARTYLGHPVHRARERADFVQSILAEMPGAEVFDTPEGRNLLAVLSENGRLLALPEIASQFDKLKALAESKVDVTVVSASEIGTEQLDRITQSLRRRLGRSVELEVVLDTTLVGGAIVRADDRVIDGSVKSRLQRLAASLIG